MFLTRAATRNPVMLLMVCIAALVLSRVALSRLPVDLFPRISIPSITVQTQYSGAGPEEVERTVTYPIEQAIARVSGVQQVVSTSRRGVSNVQVRFDWGRDLNTALVEVIQNVQRIAQNLPEGAAQPSVLRFDISNIPVVQIVVRGEGFDARQLFQMAQDTIEPQLARIDGVSQGFVNGGLVRQFNVNVDPRRLAAVGLTMQDIDNAIRRYNQLGGSGSLRNKQIDYQLRVPTLLQDVGAIRRVVVTTRRGATVQVGDVADVQDASADQTRIVKIDGEPGITISMARQPGANTVQVVDQIRRTLPRLTGIPPGVNLTIAFDQSQYIRAAISTLTHEAFIGAALTGLVVLLFLPNPWNLFMVGLTIPLSVSVAMILLYFTGQTINTFTLGGLTLSLGRLVDDAIVVRENISRHLAVPGTRVREAVLKATEEVGSAVFASTATTIAVFFPVVFLEGISRRLFVPMALTFAFAMSASYFISMTVDPVLSVKIWGRQRQKRRDAFAQLWNRFEAWNERMLDRLDLFYRRVLTGSLRRGPAVVGVIAALFVGTLYASRLIGREFFPATDESQFTVSLQLPQGTAAQISSDFADQVAEVVRRTVPREHVRIITTDAGSSGGFGGNQGPNYAQVQVRLVPPSQRTVSTIEYSSQVRRAVSGRFPGVQTFVSTGGLQQNIINFGSAAPIEVQLLGYDQTIAQPLAQEVAGIVASTAGATDVRISPRGQIPSFTVRVDHDKAAQLGLSPTTIATAVVMAISGNSGSASRLIDPVTGAQYGIVVRLQDRYRAGPEDLDDVPLAALTDSSTVVIPVGKTPITLGDVAKTSLGSEPLQITRRNQQRTISVTANVVGRPLGAVSQEIIQRMNATQLPPGFSYRMAGQTEEQSSAFGSLGMATWMALMLVYMIMASQFKSLVYPFVIMFTVPLGLIGVIWMLLATGTTLSIMSFMGIITMVGIVVSNGILLIDFTDKLRARGMGPLHAILRAGQTRLRPILMTAIATILGMAPMALGLGEGSEANTPLARAVIGGLAVSTFLTLFLIPVLYLVSERLLPKRRAEREEVV
jgi:CzcA family heavy metal efflux pump